MSYNTLFNEIINLSSLFYKNNYKKIASEILSYAPSSSPKNKDTVFKGQPGSVAPILQLSKIIDKIENSDLFQYLPQHIIKGLLKVKKMSENAFKFASDKNAFLSIALPSSPLEKLYDYLNKLEDKIDFSYLPENIITSFNRLKSNTTQLLSKQRSKDKQETKIEKTPLKTKEEKLLPPKESPKKNITDESSELLAVKKLKKSLSNYPIYKEIFYRLPSSIIKELQKIGLDPDNLSINKSASLISNTISDYYKKAMDFSSINPLFQMPTPLTNREISRALRLSIAAELDAIHLYELIADSSKDNNVKKVLQDIANEEKVHVGELQELLKSFDPDNPSFLSQGAKEIKSIIS